MAKFADYLTDDEINDLISPICELADMETETEGGPQDGDELLDALILAARAVRDREGFLVLDGDDVNWPDAGWPTTA
jgi:hypothetical protein